MWKCTSTLHLHEYAVRQKDEKYTIFLRSPHFELRHQTGKREKVKANKSRIECIPQYYPTTYLRNEKSPSEYLIDIVLCIRMRSCSVISFFFCFSCSRVLLRDACTVRSPGRMNEWMKVPFRCCWIQYLCMICLTRAQFFFAFHFLRYQVVFFAIDRQTMR